MALDPQARTVYLVAAAGLVDPAQPINGAVAPFYPNAFVDDSFELLIYRRP
jgi:hypothetical protein